jgi:hypothetical protein
MASLSEGQYTGEFILAEAPGTISRDTVTVDVPASTTLEDGTVLGELSATGHYAPYDDSKSDGSEVAAAVLIGNLVNDALAGVEVAAAVLNFCAEVRADDLQWGAGVDEDGGTADLLAIGIKAR